MLHTAERCFQCRVYKQQRLCDETLAAARKDILLLRRKSQDYFTDNTIVIVPVCGVELFEPVKVHLRAASKANPLL